MSLRPIYEYGTPQSYAEVIARSRGGCEEEARRERERESKEENWRKEGASRLLLGRRVRQVVVVESSVTSR